MTETPGRVIMLVGTSSAGKSTAAAALQGCLADHHLLVGFDVFVRMIDSRWGGHGPFTEEGFRYDPSSVAASGEVISTISCGPVGRQILNGTHRAVAALARSGYNVIVDEFLLDQEVLEDWRTALAGLSVYVVQVQAPVEVMVVRELERGQRPGLAPRPPSDQHPHLVRRHGRHLRQDPGRVRRRHRRGDRRLRRPPKPLQSGLIKVR